MKIKISALTDTGMVRNINEDAIITCADLKHPEWGMGSSSYMPLGELGALLVVADGIGGSNAGEKA